MKKTTTAPAEIVREYGPFPGVDHVHGVTYDGEHVWLAAGETVKVVRSCEWEDHALDRCRGACRNGI